MPTEITDLSVVLDEPKVVRLTPDGPLFKLPAQIPVPLMLKVQARAEQRRKAIEAAAQTKDKAARARTEEELEQELFEDLHDQVLELFNVYQPDLTAVPCTIKQLFVLIPSVYGGGIPESAKANPTRATSRIGSAKSRSSRKKPATSRSRS